jgi:hypothetical protein
MFQAKDQHPTHKFHTSLEANLDENPSTIPKRKGSIDVHVVESQTNSSIEVTTVKTEGESACTLSLSNWL